MIVGLFFKRTSGFGATALARLDAEQRVSRTETENTRGQRQHADPAPDADHACQAQGDQRQADDDAQCPINGSNIGFS